MKSATAPRYNKTHLATGEVGFAYRAEDVGFEPTRLSPAGFQDRCTRPLCESSVGEATRKGPLVTISGSYAGSSSNCSITFATPSSSHGSAMPFEYLGPSGWPSAIAYERLHHSSIEKSFGLSPNETQSSASKP